MLIEDKIKALAPNIQEVVKAVLGNKKIQVYGFTDGFTGTNEESLAIIDDQLNAFKLHVSNSKEKVLVSIASWAKQKQIYKITIIGREVDLLIFRTPISKTRLSQLLSFSQTPSLKNPLLSSSKT